MFFILVNAGASAGFGFGGSDDGEFSLFPKI